MIISIHVNDPAGSASLRRLLQRAVRETLRGEGVVEGEVSLTLVDDSGIQEMNRRWLGRDRVTDVIAFALHGDSTPAPGAPLVGDVYVGRDQAARQAAEAGISMEEELVRLAVHGVLHVCGHDHPEGHERLDSPMFRRQEERVSGIMSSSQGREGS